MNVLILACLLLTVSILSYFYITGKEITREYVLFLLLPLQIVTFATYLYCRKGDCNYLEETQVSSLLDTFLDPKQ